jgi:hypothetical protein
MCWRSSARTLPTRSTGFSEPEMLPLATGLATVEAPRRSGEAVDLGALGGTRTPNLLIRSQMLYPLSYERWRPVSLRHVRRAPCPADQSTGCRPCDVSCRGPEPAEATTPRLMRRDPGEWRPRMRTIRSRAAPAGGAFVPSQMTRRLRAGRVRAPRSRRADRWPGQQRRPVTDDRRRNAGQYGRPGRRGGGQRRPQQADRDR